MATTKIVYYIDQNNNYYINQNGDNYIAGEFYEDIPTVLSYIQYKPYFYHNGEFKKYTAYIRQADGTYIKVIPYIYRMAEIAIAGISKAGVSVVGDNI